MKKILLSSLLAVMAVTSANAKIASTDYADGVAASEAAAAETAANTYTNQKIGDLDATTNGNGVVVTNVTQTDGVVTVTKGNIAYSSLTGTPTVDTAMSDSSTNAVQNKVIKSYVDNAINTVEGDVSGKVSINQGEANKDKGLIVNASGELQLADVATDAELATVSAVANQAKEGVSDIYLSGVMTSGATKAKIDAIETNTAAIALNTALREAIENNANKVDGEGAEGTYALTAVVNEQGVSEFKWEKIGR